MKQFNNIVQSETEPNVNSLWLDNETLKVHDNGKWIPLSGESTDSTIPANIKIVTAAEYEAEEKNPEFIYFIKG